MQSPIVITNTGDVTVNALSAAQGIGGTTVGASSDVSITNHGAVMVTSTGAFAGAVGISGRADGANSAVNIVNWGPLGVTGAEAFGIAAFTFNTHSPIAITNSGNMWVNGGFETVGIDIEHDPPDSRINITNSGDLWTTASQANGEAYGIAISRSTIRRRSSRPAARSASRTISTMCGARSPPA